MWADPMRLRQVVDNLLSNAITYNRDGGTVFLGTTGDGTSSWILVRDTGVGISDAERVAPLPALLQGRPPAPRRHGSGPRHHAGTSSAPTAGSSVCTARPASGSTFIVKLPATAAPAPRIRRDLAMTLDLDSVLVMTALVVNVSGILFIVETLLRRDEGAGRVWALAFLAGDADDPRVHHLGADARCVVGDRRRQRRVRRRHRLHVARMPPIQRPADGMALADRRGGGHRARRSRSSSRGRTAGTGRARCGCSCRLLAFAGVGRDGMPARRAARVAHGVGARGGARLPVAVLCVAHDGVRHLGPRERAVPDAFGTIPTSFLTVTLTIVAVVVTSVLRAARAPMRGLPAARRLRRRERWDLLSGRVRRCDESDCARAPDGATSSWESSPCASTTSSRSRPRSGATSPAP